MKQYNLPDIRNVALVGHGSCGKTSVAEAILFTSGASVRLGKVGDTSSVMDYDTEEAKRNHSINASLAFCEWDSKKINLLDTPGDNNFIGDTPSCIRVVDGVVVVVGADDGLQFYTEKVWQWADEQNLAKIVFLNKMDHERANITPIIDAIKSKFNKIPVVLQIPVGSAESFKGVIDLVENKFFSYENGGNGQGKQEAIPEDMMDEVELRRAELVESIAEVDDELIEIYLEKGELSEEEFLTGLKNGVKKGDLVPVLCGSAIKNIGIDILMNAIMSYLPSPDLRDEVKGKLLKDGSEITCSPNPDGPVCGLVFKTIADPYSGKLTLFRVFSGTFKGDDSIYNANRESSERVGQVYMLQGKKQVPVPEIGCGDMGAVAKLKVTATGDTLCDQAKALVMDPIEFLRCSP